MEGHQAAQPAGTVLAGGTALLPGVRRLAGDIFQTPVRAGSPNGLHGVVDVLSSPAYAASVGLLEWARTQLDQPVGHGHPAPLSKALSGLGNWLRSFFP